MVFISIIIIKKYGKLTQVHIIMSDSRHYTYRHIQNVQDLISVVIKDLIDRASQHDKTKLESPELEVFDAVTGRLRGMTYGSEEYKLALKEMGPALEHHYKHNRHHPEHFENGINDMTLIDLIEMICDWLAATKRHNDGDIAQSFRINKERFEISPQLEKILWNTVTAYQK